MTEDKEGGIRMRLQGVVKSAIGFTSKKGGQYTTTILDTDQGDLVKVIVKGNGVKKGDILTVEVDLLTRGVFGETVK